MIGRTSQHFPEELDSTSRGQVDSILQAIRDRQATDVSIVGHTDAVGDSQDNYFLGLRRAEWVMKYLATLGVNTTMFEVSSHGETDMLIKTADGVREPRNQRVEVTVR